MQPEIGWGGGGGVNILTLHLDFRAIQLPFFLPKYSANTKIPSFEGKSHVETLCNEKKCDTDLLYRFLTLKLF